jgi:hypothetical protein
MRLIKNQLYRVAIIIVMLISFIPVSLVSKSAECTMVDSQMIIPGGKKSAREIDAEKVRSMLEDKIVAERLRSYGLSNEEVTAKIVNMSEGQIHQLAVLSDRVTAGGAHGYFIATTTLILIAIVAILVVVVVAVAAGG